MEKLIRRMIIIALLGVIFGFSTSAVVTSSPGRNVRFYHGADAGCVFDPNALCMARN